VNNFYLFGILFWKRLGTFCFGIANVNELALLNKDLNKKDCLNNKVDEDSISFWLEVIISLFI
jgi:hypothetical protein